MGFVTVRTRRDGRWDYQPLSLKELVSGKHKTGDLAWDLHHGNRLVVSVYGFAANTSGRALKSMCVADGMQGRIHLLTRNCEPLFMVEDHASLDDKYISISGSELPTLCVASFHG